MTSEGDTPPPSVLVAEDHAVIAMEVEERLRSLGYRVAGLAGSAAAAISLAREARPDVLLFDIHLGAGLDGIEAACAIQAERPVPVVFLSAYSDAPTLERVRAVEHSSYLLKPFGERMLQILLDAAVYRFRAAQERDAIERARRRTEARLAALLDHSPDAIISVDSDRLIVVFNRGAEAMFGYAASEMLGQPLDVLIPASVRDAHRAQVERFSAEEVPRPRERARREITCVRKSGESFPAEATIFRVDVEGDPVLSVFVRDLSERKQLELRTLQAQKLEAAGRLAAGVAHDFNNLLSVIHCNAYLAQVSAAGNPEGLAAIEEILHGVERGVALTTQMLGFVRREAARPRPTDVNGALAGMERLVRALAGGHVEVSLDLDPAAGTASVDVASLEQVVMNLVTNARDAMPRGGALVLRTARTSLDHPLETATGTAAPGTYVEISVRDAGAGMTPEVRARALEPFFTTKALGHGTGLGLATVARVVRGHDAHLCLESEVGRGTRVRLLFPSTLARQVVSSAPPPAPVSASGAPSAIPTRVLVIDDDEALCAATRAVLERAGYVVSVASHAEQALDIVTRRAPPIDVVVADVVMPLVDGRELVERLRREQPDLGVVLTSGDLVAAPPDAHGDAEHEVLRKPFVVAALLERVRLAVRGGGR